MPVMFCAERRYYGHPWNRRSPVGKGWSGSLVGVLATISLICACAAIYRPALPLNLDLGRICRDCIPVS